MTLRVELTQERPVPEARELLGRLLEAHEQRLFRLALRLTGNRDEALDLVQETFARAARRPGAVPPENAAGSWLVRILINLARDAWRRQAVRRAALRLSVRKSHVRPGDPIETTVAVREALARLPPRRRAIVVLSEIEGHTSYEIAATLQMSDATVRWHLVAARKRLRSLLQSHMGGSDAATK